MFRRFRRRSRRRGGEASGGVAAIGPRPRLLNRPESAIVKRRVYYRRADDPKNYTVEDHSDRMAQSMDSFNLVEILTTAMKDAQARVGHVNVLIAGRTGVGKSTLINSVFNSELATTGQGKPVTQTTRLIQKEGVPLRIWDTPRSGDGRLLRDTGLIDRGDTGAIAERGDPRSHPLRMALHSRTGTPGGTSRAGLVLCARRAHARSLRDHQGRCGSRIPSGGSADVAGDQERGTRTAIDEKLDDGHAVPKTGLEELVELTADSSISVVFALVVSQARQRLRFASTIPSARQYVVCTTTPVSSSISDGDTLCPDSSTQDAV